MNFLASASSRSNFQERERTLIAFLVGLLIFVRGPFYTIRRTMVISATYSPLSSLIASGSTPCWEKPRRV